MGLIPAIRPQPPVSNGSPHTAEAAPQVTAVGSAQVKGAAAVADTLHRRAVYPPEPKPGAERHLAQPKHDPVSRAENHAEAAREAYIRASIVAGISPLPLPGV